MTSTASRRPGTSRVLERVIDDSTIESVVAHGNEFLAIARRYSQNATDADDAYQRAMEILVTKAPTDDVGELVRWLAVVVRNEALCIARDGRRIEVLPIDEITDTAISQDPGPEEAQAMSDDLAIRKEAIGATSADESRCLLLRAEGLSYREIVDHTGFSARKVERCLSNGRSKISKRMQMIRTGSECDRVEPFLSRAADGDLDVIREVRDHLHNCGACRATLREYRSAPKRFAAIMPLGIALPESGLDELTGGIQQLAAELHDRINTHVIAVQNWLEVGGIKKAAAVVAATSVIAGGGAAAGEQLVFSNNGSVAELADGQVRSVGSATRELLPPQAAQIGPKSRDETRNPIERRQKETDSRVQSGDQTLTPETNGAHDRASPNSAVEPAPGVGDLTP